VQFFESSLYLLFVIMAFLMIVKKSVKSVYILSVLLVGGALFIAHLSFEDVRWQLYPLYIALGVCGSFVYMKHGMQKTLGKKTKNAFMSVAFIFAGLFLASFFAFPVYELPEPGGNHPIGTQSFVIEDEDRIEQYGDLSGTYRKFKIQTWYPAKTIEGYERMPWIEEGKTVTRALSRDIGLPYFFLDHTADIMSHAYQGAPVSDSSDVYPVVILSHGWRGLKSIHTDYAEELASRGFIVVGIDHTYGSVATVMDGKSYYLDSEALPPRETTDNFLDHANRLVNTYASDITSTIDYLEAMKEGTYASVFSAALDLSKIGLLGHSTGGGGGVYAALEDDRIKAVMGLDAWVEPIDGTTHYDFAMVYMYSPLTRLIGFSGSVDSERLTPMLKSMISTYFEATLAGDASYDIDEEKWDEVGKISIE